MVLTTARICPLLSRNQIRAFLLWLRLSVSMSGEAKALLISNLLSKLSPTSKPAALQLAFSVVWKLEVRIQAFYANLFVDVHELGYYS